MRFDFQFSLNEWIEWKHANLSRNRFVLLRIAESSVIPLAILCALTIVFGSLRYLPSWLPIVMVGLIALGQIYLSTVPRFGRGALKKEWLTKRAFASKQQLDEFLELAYQKTVSERQAA